MGRSGIRPRKWRIKHPKSGHGSAGIIEDLEDQAEWSSYAGHIPRGGDPRRSAIWWQRGFRFYRNLGHPGRNPALRSRGWWLGVLTGTAIAVGVWAAIALVLWILGRVL